MKTNFAEMCRSSERDFAPNVGPRVSREERTSAPSKRISLAGLALLAASFAFPLRAAGDRFAAIPTSVAPFVERGEISGAVMAVADKDHVLHLSAVGKSDLATGRDMRTN